MAMHKNVRPQIRADLANSKSGPVASPPQRLRNASGLPGSRVVGGEDKPCFAVYGCNRQRDGRFLWTSSFSIEAP